jgi:hypothetical protein
MGATEAALMAASFYRWALLDETVPTFEKGVVGSRLDPTLDVLA